MEGAEMSPLEQQIEQWVHDNLNRISSHDPATIHIDQLLHKDVKGEAALAASLQAFMVLVGQIRPLQTPAQPTLVIPLLDGLRIGADAPNDEQILKSQL